MFEGMFDAEGPGGSYADWWVLYCCCTNCTAVLVVQLVPALLARLPSLPQLNVCDCAVYLDWLFVHGLHASQSLDINVGCDA